MYNITVRLQGKIVTTILNCETFEDAEQFLINNKFPLKEHGFNLCYCYERRPVDWPTKTEFLASIDRIVAERKATHTQTAVQTRPVQF
jgi:hypothetical protein